MFKNQLKLNCSYLLSTERWSAGSRLKSVPTFRPLGARLERQLRAAADGCLPALSLTEVMGGTELTVLSRQVTPHCAANTANH